MIMEFKSHAVLQNLCNSQKEGISIFYLLTLRKIIIDIQIVLAEVSLHMYIRARGKKITLGLKINPFS